MSINDKIKQVLTIKNLSPSYLADDIGVQRSSISHILSGRNRPSLDIIQKIVRRFPEFTYEWFLEADTQLSSADSTPLDKPVPESPLPNRRQPQNDRVPTRLAAPLVSPVANNETIIPDSSNLAKPAIERILIFYSDGTFREYTPTS